MWKYRDLAEHLVSTGIVSSFDEFVKPSGEAPHEYALLAHDHGYYFGFVNDSLESKMMRQIGFAGRPDHLDLVRCVRVGVSGMVLAARLALEHGSVACNLTGGTHHAHRDWGSGYNPLNDLAISAKVLLEEGLVQRICVVDLDVHQGDGTAAICADDSRIFTFSMHCGDNFPFGFKGLAHLGHDRSDLDVALPAGAGDEVFMSQLQDHLPYVLERVRPDLVLYQAGVDVHENDHLGKLHVTDKGIERRDRFVLETCILQHGVPVACAVGGGYAKNSVAGRLQLALRHAVLCRAAVSVWQRQQQH